MANDTHTFWSTLKLIVSLVLMSIVFGSALIEPYFLAEAISEDLGPQVGVDEKLIRTHLEKILQHTSVREAVVRCVPLAIISLLLAVDVISDWKTKADKPAGNESKYGK